MMAITINNPELDQLARELVKVTGEDLTEAISKALKERIARESKQRDVSGIRKEISLIQRRIAALPRLDDRSDEDIIGYSKEGLVS